nr:hypothetical protein [Pseudomonas juntendi]
MQQCQQSLLLMFCPLVLHQAGDQVGPWSRLRSGAQLSFDLSPWALQQCGEHQQVAALQVDLVASGNTEKDLISDRESVDQVLLAIEVGQEHQGTLQLASQPQHRVPLTDFREQSAPFPLAASQRSARVTR